MKNLSIAFVTVLSLAAFAGCKKKGGDCDSTTSAAIDRMMDEQTKKVPKDMSPEDQKKMVEDGKKMMPKLKATLAKVCTDDKWPAEMLKCIDAAKSMEEGTACNKTLSDDQKAHLQKEMTAVMMGDMKGDDMKGGDMKGGDMKGGDMKGGDMKGGDMKGGDMGSSGSAAPGSAAPAGGDGSAAAAGGGGGGDLPKECQDYKAAIDKLASCDKMPQQARDAMKQGFETASKAWAGLPADAKASLATGCKAGTDAVTQSAKAVCGW